MTRIMRIDEFAAQMVNEMAVRPDVFKDYEEFDIFDSTYFIVKNKNGLYNLSDRNGNLISDLWFEKITKNDDGTVETVVKDNTSKSHTATYSDPKEFEDCIEVQRDVLDGISLPKWIDFDDVIPVTPYRIKTPDTNFTVTIIAKVMLDGKKLLLGKDGKLYNADGSLYVVNDGSPIATNDIVKKYKLVYNQQTGLYDCNGDIRVVDDLVSNGKFIIKFGVVGGRFVCSSNRLVSLEGAPQKVGGDFSCAHNQLTSLEGAPQEVGDDFHCDSNELTTLNGAPQIVDGDFWCYDNQLTSLEGAPQIVGGIFCCSDNNLTSLEGAPQEVGGNFDCYNNPLTSFNGLPETINGKFDCEFNKHKEWSVAQKICALVIINRFSEFVEKNSDLFNFHIETDYIVPKRFGNFDAGTIIQVHPYDKPINDASVNIIGYYENEDGSWDNDTWDLSRFNKKEQNDILNAILDKIQ